MHLSSLNYYNNQISISPLNKTNFKSNTERAKFHPDTINIVDNVYADYKKSLNEIPFNEVRKTALKVSEEMQIPKKDVVKAMQLLTQFSNMKSLITISKAIQKENVQYLGNKDSELAFKSIDKGLFRKNVQKFCDETGINNSLTYVLEKKNLAPFSSEDGENIGLILDEDKISQLEQVKKSQPEEFKNLVKNKDLKFFYISGWDTGIPVIDRTKNLEDKTIELLNRAKENDLPLEKAIDYPNIDRIKALGIKPIVIKNENEANELAVYNQMKPEQLNTKNSLYNVIEANTISRYSGKNDAIKAIKNHVSAKYLEKALSVYTPEKMSKDLKLMHSMIEDYAKKENREVVYILPKKKIKSNDYVNYSYRKINNVEYSKFIHIDDLDTYHKNNPERNERNTLYVVLDDCALSGNSMVSALSYGFNDAKDRTPILFANLKCSREAFANFINTSSHPTDIIYVDKINSEYLGSEELENLIGETDYKEEAYALAFPYMAPDNNCELGSNIALLHNPKYNSRNLSSEFQRNHYTRRDLKKLDSYEQIKIERAQKQKLADCSSSKTLSDNVFKVSAEYTKLIGSKYNEYPASESKHLTSQDLDEAVDELLN